MTVSIPELLEVLASHSYSASSSKTDLLMMRMRFTPSEIISYFLPFLISLPSLNQRTYSKLTLEYSAKQAFNDHLRMPIICIMNLLILKVS